MRRSGTGRESDEKSDLPSYFPHFEIMDTNMGDCGPLHLLDSAASSNPAIAEAEGGDDASTEADSQPTLSDSAASSQSTSPVTAVSSHPSTPAPVPATSSCPTTPGPPASNPSSTPLPDDDTHIPKKKRRRVTSVQRAETADNSFVKDMC